VKLDILIAGVGGQGTLLAAKVLGGYAADSGYDCKLSEVHGMSQRGGSVITHARLSDGAVYSPIIPDGECDVLLAFEQLEALRWAYAVKKGGTIIVSTQKTPPLPVITGAEIYPPDILERLKAAGVNVVAVDAASVAEAGGSVKAANTVILGVLAKVQGLNADAFLKAVLSCVPPRAKDINGAAFLSGYGLSV
jgi:indolepyruvate ferredoxin oxidoreductase beta subunit